MQLYLYNMSDAASDEEFLKIGVSQDASKRFAWGTTSVKDSTLPFGEKIKRMMAGENYITDHPYDSTLLHAVDFELEGFAWEAEADLLAVLKGAGASYWPRKAFPGRSECFLCEDEVKAMIIAWMNDCAAKAPRGPDLLYYKLAEVRVRDDKPLLKHRKVLAILKDEGRWP